MDDDGVHPIALRRLRENALLSQEDLAERAGVSVRTVRNLEAGRIERPRPSTMARLATALGLDAVGALHARPLPTGPPAETAGPAVPPEQLPPDVVSFVERRTALAALDLLLVRARAGTGQPLAVVSGTSGVGKTALAVRWAHRVRDRFPDGVLYAELGGYGRGEPVDPGAVLASWLRALGVADGRLPGTAQEKAALFRSVSAHREILVVIDNARSADQVRPLLPGSGGCFALVTSRDSLGSLVALDGAGRVPLDPLSVAEARALLRALLPTEPAAEPDAERELIGYCCGLPLAIRIAAELADADGSAPLSTLNARLRDERSRIDVFDLGDDRSALRGIFSWSYRTLSAPAARMFRLLGIEPCGGLDDAATAALAGVAPEEARHLVQELIRAHLVSTGTAGPGRHGMHDLLRAYARERARPADDLRVDALLDHHLSAASAAVRMIAPSEAPALPSPPTDPPEFAGAAEAREWLTENLPALLAGAAWAADNGRHERVIALSAVLRRHLFLGGHRRPALALHGRAYRAARHIGDAAAEGASLSAIAQIRWRGGDLTEAARRYRQALTVLQRAGDIGAEATAWGGLGLVYGQQRRSDEAMDCFDQAMKIARSVGDERGEALALANLGNVHRWSGRTDEAVALYERTLVVFRRLGDRANEGVVHANIGDLNHQNGRLTNAAKHFRRALRIAEDVGDAATVSDMMTHLGLIADESGDVDEAVALHDRALAVARRAGHRSREAAAAHHIGTLHQRRGEYGQAAQWHRGALAIADVVNEPPLRCRARNALGESLSGLGKGDEARRWHVEALRIAQLAGCTDEAERAARALAATA